MKSITFHDKQNLFIIMILLCLTYKYIDTSQDKHKDWKGFVWHLIECTFWRLYFPTEMIYTNKYWLWLDLHPPIEAHPDSFFYFFPFFLSAEVFKLLQTKESNWF